MNSNFFISELIRLGRYPPSLDCCSVSIITARLVLDLLSFFCIKFASIIAARGQSCGNAFMVDSKSGYRDNLSITIGSDFISLAVLVL